MKQKKSILLIFLISNIIILNSFIGISSIEVDVDYTYKVTQSRIYAKVGDNKYTLNGFRFGGVTYPTDTSVSCVITNFDQGSIDYNCTIDDQMRVGFSVPNWINRIFDYYMIYTTVKTYELVENWQNIALFNLFFFVMKSYVHPATYNWNFINTLENTLYNTYNHTTNFPGVVCEFHMTKINELISIESWIGGKIEGLYGEQFDADTSLSSNFSFGNNFHISYSNTSGLVQGMGYRGWVQGTINNLPVRVSIEYQYELQNFSLPDYGYGKYRKFSDNGILLAILIPSSMIIIITIPTVIYLKKKRKPNIEKNKE